MFHVIQLGSDRKKARRMSSLSCDKCIKGASCGTNLRRARVRCNVSPEDMECIMLLLICALHKDRDGRAIRYTYAVLDG